jgi:hypothetical protein
VQRRVTGVNLVLDLVREEVADAALDAPTATGSAASAGCSASRRRAAVSSWRTIMRISASNAA